MTTSPATFSQLHPRHQDYYRRLVEYIDVVYRKPFVYGTFDCALWGADALQIQLDDGYDIASRWRGQYTTLLEGMKLVKKAGYLDYIDVFAKELPSIPAARVQSGDLIVVGGVGGMESIGVVVRNIVYAPTEKGLGIVTIAEGIRAFAVGRNPAEDADV